MTGGTTIVIDGPIWFVGALVICGWHTYCLWGWRRERRAHLAWWKRYDADAYARHAEFMHALRPSGLTADAWVLDGSRENGQA